MIAETIAAAKQAGSTEVLSALRAASAKTGSNFDYLLATAQRESSLDSHAKSKTSSASGLFQFIDQTWLGLIKQFGERHGLGAYAGAIRQTGKGGFDVSSPDAKAAILALRQNPTLSALMAGEAANETKRSLECVLGRGVCTGELYAAHFLGQGGARQLIELNQSNPNARADQAFPQVAGANRSAFYHADGTPKSVGEVYTWVVNLPGGEGAKTAAVQPAIAHANNSAFEIASLSDAQDNFAAPSRTAPVEDAAKENGRPPALRGTALSPSETPAVPAVQPNRLPQSPLLLTPGIMEILATITPLRRAI